MHLLWLIYGQFFTKSVKPFRSYFSYLDLTFSFDLHRWVKGHQVFFLHILCMVKILNESVKTFRSYCKIQDLKLVMTLTIGVKGSKY